MERHTDGKYPGQTQLTLTPKSRRANSVASILLSKMVAALEALYLNCPRCDVWVIPDIEDRIMTFPGSGYPPTVLAADRRGRKAKVVKWYEAVLILYVSALNLSSCIIS